jgi:hypothetical protein
MKVIKVVSIFSAGYVFARVRRSIVPKLVKDTLKDMVMEGIENKIDERHMKPRNRHTSSSYVSYNGRSNYRGTRPRYIPYRYRQDRSSLSLPGNLFSESTFPTRSEAEEVVDALFDRIEKYNFASVADFCILIKVEPKIEDEKWGWTDLSGSSVSTLRRDQGYHVSLPTPVPLEDVIMPETDENPSESKETE